VVLSLHEPEPFVAGDSGGAWGALKGSLSAAVENFVLAIAGIIAFTGGALPVVAALVLVGWLVRKAWRRRKRSA